MAINWRELGRGQHGLAVESKTDQEIIEAFLNAADGKEDRWSNWRTQVMIQPAGSWANVIQAVKEPHNVPKYAGEIWGLIDRDWRSPDEVKKLKADHPRLFVLPRIMIENYLINPDEITSLLLINQKTGKQNALKVQIEGELERWLQHGALWQILDEHGANKFCQDKEGNPGYPGALRREPLNDDEITRILQDFRNQLDPTKILSAHRAKLSEFQSRSNKEKYRQCIYGKMFFNQVVVKALSDIITLNPKEKKDRGSWISRLIDSPNDCPTDLIPLLQKLLS
jgi:hypothetical protein